jgi:uncharacterized protein YegP (UPF0339 family)
MSGTFELYQDKADKYRFRLKASNGQVVAASQSYESKPSAINGIESVKNSSVEAPRLRYPETTRSSVEVLAHDRRIRPGNPGKGRCLS